MPADRKHFLIQLLLDQRKRWLIWYSGERDGFVLRAPDRIVSFETLEKAVSFAINDQIVIEPTATPATYDFDRLIRWTNRRLPQQVECEEFLDAWNLLTDVVATVGGSTRFTAIDLKLEPLYKKLFWGSNLPSVTPNRKRYTPSWSETEVASLAKLLRIGINELRRATSV